MEREVMLMVQVLVYFAVWSVVLIAAFAVYARLLRLVARFPRPVKLLLSLCIYLAFACVLVLPLAGLAVNESWRLAVNSSLLFAVQFLGCYLLAAVPGVMRFKHRHLDELKGLGYFRSTSHWG